MHQVATIPRQERAYQGRGIEASRMIGVNIEENRMTPESTAIEVTKKRLG